MLFAFKACKLNSHQAHKQSFVKVAGSNLNSLAIVSTVHKYNLGVIKHGQLLYSLETRALRVLLKAAFKPLAFLLGTENSTISQH